MNQICAIVATSMSVALFMVGVATTDSNFIIASGVFSITLAIFLKGGAE